MSLETGLYLIRHQPSGVLVSRHVVEDRSLLPKRVTSFPPSFEEQHATWVIESLGGGNYHLANRGGTATNIDGKLLANLLPSRGNDVWAIKRESEPNVFTISNEGGGWHLPSADPEEQVEVKVGSPGDKWVITLVN